MSIAAVYGLPGMRAAVTAGHRTVFKGGRWDWVSIPTGVKIIDGSLSRDAGNSGFEQDLRAGLFMGKVTSGGKYRPSFIGVNTVAYADNDTTITISAATATELARLKALGGGGNLSLSFIGPPTVAGTVAVTAVTATAITINGASSTITTADLNLNKVVNSLIALADGSQIPRTVIPDGWPMKVTDAQGTSVDIEFAKLPIGGTIEEAFTLPVAMSSLDASTRAWIIAQMNSTSSGQFVYDGDF